MLQIRWKEEEEKEEQHLEEEMEIEEMEKNKEQQTEDKTGAVTNSRGEEGGRVADK